MTKQTASNTTIATRRVIDTASLLLETEQEVSPPAVHLTTNPSRNPLDDPDLARYLLPRAPIPPAHPHELTSQELVDQLLCITPISTHVPGPPRPNAQAAFAALLGELRDEVREQEECSELP